MAEIKYDFKAKGLELQTMIKASGRVLLVTGGNRTGKTLLLSVVESAARFNSMVNGGDRSEIFSTIWDPYTESQNILRAEILLATLKQLRHTKNKIVLLDEFGVYTAEQMDMVLAELRSQAQNGGIKLALVATVRWGQKLAVREYKPS